MFEQYRSDRTAGLLFSETEIAQRPRWVEDDHVQQHVLISRCVAA